MRVVSFDVATDTMTSTSNFPFTFEPLQTNVDGDSNVLLRDNAHGLFRLWFILVDGESQSSDHYYYYYYFFLISPVSKCADTEQI